MPTTGPGGTTPTWGSSSSTSGARRTTSTATAPTWSSSSTRPILGDRLLRYPLEFHSNDIHGTLQDKADSPAPGDFVLSFTARDADNPNYYVGAQAEIAIDVLADGTVDVRGVSRMFAAQQGTFVVEGVGNAKFVVPDLQQPSRTP